jgi:glyoxylase-like metal-dependent hydrolase (beta-lactamase superfamily II)
MIVTLEPLRAAFGDCLLLHYGKGRDVQRVLIDGGPGGTYRDSLEPRLTQLRGDSEDPLRLRLAMISHIDTDHIAGIVDLFDRLVEQADDGKPPEVEVEALWFNAFEHLTGAGRGGASSAEVRGAATAMVAATPGSESAAVAASVAEGVTLREDAKRLGVPTNPEFDGLVVADGDKPTVCEVDDDLTLTVLAPTSSRVEKLKKKWLEWETKHAHKPTKQTAAYVDQSVYNLSSIVVLATVGKRRLLLTGDARGDHIIEGLTAAGEIGSDGRAEVDVLKLPHHGSGRNVSPEFFETVRARHYVCSGDGVHDNPEIRALGWLFDARKGDKEPWTLWLTYGGTPDDGRFDLGKRVGKFLDERKKAGDKVDVRFAEASKPLLIDLGETPLQHGG